MRGYGCSTAVLSKYALMFFCVVINSSNANTDTTATVKTTTTIDMCPALITDLAKQPEFNDPSNECCYQESSRSSCGDLNFCFGISLSHPFSIHSACCEGSSDYPSCVAFVRLQSGLDRLRALSTADVIISVLIVLLSCIDVFFFVCGRPRPVKLLLFILTLEFLNLCLSWAMIVGVIDRYNMVETALSLLQSSCFNDAGNEANIASVHDELTNIRIFSIMEAVGGFVVMASHSASVYFLSYAEGSSSRKESFATTAGFVLDVLECMAAVINLAVFLLPTLRSFDSLYATLGADSTAVTAPCVRSCCAIQNLLPGSVTNTANPVSSVTNTDNPTPSMAFPTPSPTSSPITVATECMVNSDCVLGKCAFESYTVTAKSRCCPTGTSEKIYDFEDEAFPKSDDAYFCRGQLSGARCPKNSLCNSNVCIFGLCEEAPRSTDEKCEENADCISSVCYGGKCKAGALSANENCELNSHCEFGSCAFGSYTRGSKMICCPTGASERIYSFEDAYPKENDAYFCKGQPTGARCPKNSLCDSNVCIFGLCEEAPRGTDEECEENADCVSNVCFEGKCKAGALSANENCELNSHCEFGSCAFGSYTLGSKMICCPTGASEKIYSFEDAYPKENSAYFCKGQPTGARCPKNSLCDSNLCIFGVCEETARVTDEECEENEDCVSLVCVKGKCKAGTLSANEECEENSHCAFGSCAFDSYTSVSKARCCPTGGREQIYSYEDEFYPKDNTAYFCKNQPVGSRCPKNSLCESGICILGLCAEVRNEAGETCEEDADCSSSVCVKSRCRSGTLAASEECESNSHCALGMCAYESYTASAKLHCCPSGTSEQIDSWRYDNYPKGSTARFCVAQPDGARCATSSMCESNNCVNSVCTAA